MADKQLDKVAINSLGALFGCFDGNRSLGDRSCSWSSLIRS